MPKKYKGKVPFNRAVRPFNKYNDGSEVFRNASAVSDDTDPHQSLKYLIEIFHGKIDNDVISMVFSECAYNVDQAIETLMSLSSDEHVKLSDHFNNSTIQPEKSHQKKLEEKKDIGKHITTLNEQNQRGNNTSLNNIFPSNSVIKDFSTLNLDKSEFQQNNVPNSFLYSSLFIPQNFTTQVSSHSTSEYPNNFTQNQYYTHSLPEFISPIFPNAHLQNEKVSAKNKKLNNASKEHSQYKFQAYQPPTQADIDWKRNASKIKHTRDLINSGCSVLIILRGLPGSGKSTLAQKLKFSGVVFSSDDFFSQNGSYNYDRSLLQEAHSWNENQTKKALSNGITPVIIDNTNTEVWEMAPYVALGKKFNYQVMILEPNTPWKFKVKELTFKNKHGVPKEKIRNMLLRYQHSVSLESFSKPQNVPEKRSNGVTSVSPGKMEKNFKVNLCNNNIKSSIQSNFLSAIGSGEQLAVEHIDENVSHESPIICSPDIKSINYKYDSLDSIDEVVNQSLSLEAVIHQEEKPSDFLLESQATSLNLEFPAVSLSQENYPHYHNETHANESLKNVESFGSVGPLPENLTFKNLDELRSLVQDDSEDSQSLCRDDILKSSDQDLSSWQEITVHDDDFLWKSESEEQCSVFNCIQTVSEKNNNESFDTSTNYLNENIGGMNNYKNANFTSEPNIINNCHEFASGYLKVEENSLSNDENSLDNTDNAINLLPYNFRKSLSLDSRVDNSTKMTNLCPSLSSEGPQFSIKNSQLVVLEIPDVCTIDNTKLQILKKSEPHISNAELSSSVEATCIDRETLNTPKIVLNRQTAKSFDESLIYSEKINETNLSKLKYFSFPHLEFGLAEDKKPVISLKNEFINKKDSNKSTPDKVKETTAENIKNPLWIGDDVDDSSWVNVSENCNVHPEKHRLSISGSLYLSNNLVPCRDISSKKDNYLSEPKAHQNIEKTNLISSTYFKEKKPKSRLADSEYCNLANDCDDWRSEKGTSDSCNNCSAQDDLPKPQRQISKYISLDSFDESTNNLVINNKKEILSELCVNVNNVNKQQQNKRISQKRSPLIKQNDLSSGKDWIFPQYESTPSHSESKLEEISISYCTSETQVEASDFVLLYQIETNRTFMTNYSIVAPSVVCSEDTGAQNCLLDFDLVPQIVKFEKSTNTDDLFEDTEISQKIINLRECFPDISEEDLTHLLILCHEDETWLTSLLLDAGYKYNNPNLELVNNNNTLVENNVQDKKILPAVQLTEQESISTISELKTETNQFLSSVCLQKNTEPQADDRKENINSDETRGLSDANTFEKIQLVLDPAFALQLEELFGPILPNGASVNRTVEFGLDFAKLIYDKWKSTVKETLQPIFKNKEKKTQSLEEQIKNEIITFQRAKNNLSFSEIMDLEYAQQAYKTQKLKKDKDFSTKWQRKELYNMFPGADTIALDEIFESNNCSLKDSVLALGEDFGEPAAISKAKETQEIQERLKEWNKLNVLKEFENDDWSSWVYSEDCNDVEYENDNPLPTSTISAEAERLRKKAAEHYVLRQESIKKAQTAYCRGMKDVASFYAQEGNEHGMKYKEFNKEASTLILQERNAALPPQVLDLHGLHVQEAIPCLESFLKTERQRKSQTGLTKVSVITGQGLHSIRGPKLRSSVVEFLKSAGYGFSEINLGVLEVYLKPD